MLPKPPRTASRRRVYGQMESRTLAFIRRARELGFTLDDIRALLALAAEGGHQACVEVRDLAARHLADVRAKMTSPRWKAFLLMRSPAATRANQPIVR
jgi:MerR family mercuric resistance operon transcriptional regulator